MTDPLIQQSRMMLAGVTLALFALAANIPYTALIQLFDYDDVLRRPAGEVLTAFRAGGTPLVLAWWGFALAAFGFAIGAALLGDALKDRGMPASVTLFGVLSGVLQAAALLRWTFAIPHIAEDYAMAAPGSAEQAAAIASYTLLNWFAGGAVGEHLGQMLLALWTFGVALTLSRMGGALTWIGRAGFATLPLWIVGQSELLAPVMPGLPTLEVIPFAFMAWEMWLLVMGVALILRASRQQAM